ncbi:hypothetical protein [Nesterenkonia rhizosphaerae]|uniref:Transposase IS30-like HTH domain-containing protein n=1 Tax=Nesterenkonia rhizosphaerae TaxID=1348272 RepID=A0ABP9G1W2_9MICC
MTEDIRYLLSLGVSIEEIARRTGNKPAAIRKELQKEHEKQEAARVRR